MIQPNPVRSIPIEELRVGNLVSKGSDKIWKVYSISNLSNQDYYGIPITKELLVEKCVAEDYFSDTVMIHINGGVLRFHLNTNDFYLVCDTSAYHLPHIKYLHQLQNLIHSLTGNELTIKI